MSRVELVGVLNVTPDSFSDGDLYLDAEKALAHAQELIKDGASYLDVGAESTRPGATPLTPEQEWDRLQPVLSKLRFSQLGHIMIDTYHPKTFRQARQTLGPVIINDVTSFNNPLMIEAAAELRARCVVSHLPAAYGQDIQAAHTSNNKVDSITQVQDELLAKRERMIHAGIHPDMIILDPGIGFGKTVELNWELLEFARLVPDIDVMVGYSRKRFLGEHRMDIEPNVVAGRIAIAAGTKFLRVHDVAGHRVLLSR